MLSTVEKATSLWAECMHLSFCMAGHRAQSTCTPQESRRGKEGAQWGDPGRPGNLHSPELHCRHQEAYILFCLVTVMHCLGRHVKKGGLG